MSQAKKILIIDDDASLTDCYRIILEHEGYEVFSAGNAAEGLAAAEREDPDVIILDVIMEEADSGFQVARKLGGIKPILMLSSIAGAADQLFDTSSLPISDLAEKPLTPDDLRKRVAALLERCGSGPSTTGRA